jgi:hypothetical protein
LLTLQERADNYLASFPHIRVMPIQIHNNNQIFTTWVVGNNYKNKTKFYGTYPPTILKRIKSLFPDCKNIFHLFSGVVIPEAGEITFDINPELKPMICDDVRNITNHKKIIEKIDLIIADPPYEDSDFEKYNCKPFDRNQVIRNLAKIMKPEAFLAWLDTRKPRYRKDTWDYIGLITVDVSTMHRLRGWFLFQKR